jgi:HK97 family phage prohead protease
MARVAPLPGVALVRATKAAEKAPGSRSVRFIASDESVDRYGDIIRVAGWDVAAFRTNPVLLFGHKSSALPVGKVVDIVVDTKAKQLIADAEFMPEGMSDFADEVWRAVDGGFLNASSVGFLPTQSPNPIWKNDDEESGILTGYEFVAQELLELSVVPVPANPQALAVAKALSISAETQARIFESDSRADVARALAEARRRTLTIARQRAGSFA